ncbi:unnamed protein product, partial [Polarella glacialis]
EAIWAAESTGRFAAFRIVLTELVACDFSIDSSVDSVYYNREDITDRVEGDLGDVYSRKTFSFNRTHGAQLVISGHTSQVGNESCNDAGFQIVCSNGLLATTGGWQSVGSNKVLGSEVQAGGGEGWAVPCEGTNFLPRVHERTLLPKIWSADGRYAAFRVTPEEVTTCSFTFDGIVEYVSYGGKDFTPHVTGDLSNSSSTKHVTFHSLTGAYLAIAGQAKEGCSGGGLQVSCDGNISTRVEWQSFASESALSPASRSGHASGGPWFRPCRAEGLSGDTSPELIEASSGAAVQRIWDVRATSGSRVAFRWRDPGSDWTLVLHSAIDNGAFAYSAKLWTDPSVEPFGSAKDGENELSKDFTGIGVYQVKLVMNGKEALLSVPHQFMGMYSLQELANARATATLRGFVSSMFPSSEPSDTSSSVSPTLLPTGDLPGWQSEGVVDAFGLLSGQAQKRYCGTGFDIRKPSSLGVPRARIGSLLDQDANCQGTGTAEGIGLYDGADTSSSGIVDFAGRRFFQVTSVSVTGQAWVNGSVRLQAPLGSSSGLLEVFYDGLWGQACSEGFDATAADVACRAMGYSGGKLSSSLFSSKISLASAICTGLEAHLYSCDNIFHDVGSSGCTSAARVQCTVPELEVVVTWTGCFVTSDSVWVAGPRDFGFTTEACALACEDYPFMALQNSGYCACGRTVPDDKQKVKSYVPGSSSVCGYVCPGEGSLSPMRLCGSAYRSAVYSLPAVEFSIAFILVGLDYNLISANQSCVDFVVEAVRSQLAVAASVPEAAVSVLLQEDASDSGVSVRVEGVIRPPKGMVASAKLSLASNEGLMDFTSVVSGVTCVQAVLGNATISSGNFSVAQTASPSPYTPPQVVVNDTNGVNSSDNEEELPESPEVGPRIFNASYYNSARYTAPSKFLRARQTGQGTTWALRAVTQTLTSGRHYRLCTDLDGVENESLLIGDTGLTVFVSPVTMVAPQQLVAGSSNPVVLSCERGGCEFLLKGFLAVSCSRLPEPDEGDEVCAPPPDVAISGFELQAEEQSSNSSEFNSSNSSDLTGPAALSSRGNRTQVMATPLADIDQTSLVLFEIQLQTSCLAPGRYRFCLLGQGPNASYGHVAAAEDGGFAIDVLATE